MVEVHCFVHCYNCRRKIKLTFQVAKADATATTPTIQKSVTCTKCGRLNIADIPERWGAQPLILGDAYVVGYHEGLPILEGRST